MWNLHRQYLTRAGSVRYGDYSICIALLGKPGLPDTTITLEHEREGTALHV